MRHQGILRERSRKEEYAFMDRKKKVTLKDIVIGAETIVDGEWLSWDYDTHTYGGRNFFEEVPVGTWCWIGDHEAVLPFRPKLERVVFTTERINPCYLCENSNPNHIVLQKLPDNTWELKDSNGPPNLREKQEFYNIRIVDNGVREKDPTEEVSENPVYIKAQKVILGVLSLYLEKTYTWEKQDSPWIKKSLKKAIKAVLPAKDEVISRVKEWNSPENEDKSIEELVEEFPFNLAKKSLDKSLQKRLNARK